MTANVVTPRRLGETRSLPLTAGAAVAAGRCQSLAETECGWTQESIQDAKSMLHEPLAQIKYTRKYVTPPEILPSHCLCHAKDMQNANTHMYKCVFSAQQLHGAERHYNDV